MGSSLVGEGGRLASAGLMDTLGLMEARQATVWVTA